MPRMKGAAMQCCMCLTGVFMFLGGVIMLATGITLILNYGFFDEDLLPPDLQNEQGKRTVGIILTCCGVLAIAISVIVSLIYFCFKPKSHTVNPDDLTRIPQTARSTPEGTVNTRRGEKRPNNSTVKVPNGASRSHHHNHHNPKPTPGSAEVKHPRQYKKGRHKHRGRHVRRLEEIKEQDAISRKTVDGALNDNEFMESYRSGSISSEMTVDDPQRQLPKVILSDHDQNRPPSECSVSTSMTSDTSNFRYLENDKSRRECQFMSDSMKLGETASMEHYNEAFDYKNCDQYSETSEVLREPPINSHTASQNSDQGDSAGRMQSRDDDVIAQSSATSLKDSEYMVSRYKATHESELHGNKTAGRMTPQVGEPEIVTIVRPVAEKSDIS